MDLIDSNGTPRFGFHPAPFDDLNISAFRPHGEKKTNFLERLFIKELKLKRWLFLGAATPDIIFGCALVDTGYLANFFAYAFERKEKKLTETSVVSPAGAGMNFTGTDANGCAAFNLQGAEYKADITPVRAGLKLKAKGLEVDLDFARPAEPLCLVTQNGLKGFNYTDKAMGLHAKGIITASGKSFKLSGEPAGIYDYTFGTPARNTFWNWASGAGRDSKGREIGFNFSRGINETGHTENAFWVNGKLIKTAHADFNYDDLNVLLPWKITSEDGAIDLVFTPEGERKANINMGAIKSFFHQPFGSFSGKLSDGKEAYIIESVPGFVEEHEAKW